MKIQFSVPFLPPIECSPNWRGHWSKRYQASREYQAAVFYQAVDFRNRSLANWVGYYPYPLNKAKINLTFVFATKRKRDIDNLIARFKPGGDGLVQAGLLVGDDEEHLTFGEIKIEIDDRAPLTIIELTEAEK